MVFFLGTFLLMIMAVLDTFFLLHWQHKTLSLDKVLGSFQQGKATRNLWDEKARLSKDGFPQGDWCPS